VTHQRLAVALTAALTGAGFTACAGRVPNGVTGAPPATAVITAATLQTDLDALFDAAPFSHALVAVHVESLADGRILYSRHANTRVVPASALKIITAAVAADRLGWTHRFETRLDAVGPVVDGVLNGDLVVVGSGDPTINAQNLESAPLFDQWADTLRRAGIRHIAGRIIGDDSAFEDEPLGAGWAWDYLTAGYAAPSGALSYNENLVAVSLSPGTTPGEAARVHIAPPGHGLAVNNLVRTGATGATPALTLERLPGSHTLTLRGEVPLDGAPIVRATTVVNPTYFFVEGLRLALTRHGLRVAGGAVDIDELSAAPAPATGRTLATHQSPPLSAIVAQMMKVSQNFYGEMLIKALGRSATDEGAGVGSTARGREAIRQTLGAWGIPYDTLVTHDGSGLSRYNYASAQLLVDVLRHMWHDQTHRGPFVAALPVAGHDGTLGSRMKTGLRRRVQAKTGTISNVRSLAGYAETDGGEKLVFTMITNHFVAPNAEVDRVMEEALLRLLSDTTGTSSGR